MNYYSLSLVIIILFLCSCSKNKTVHPDSIQYSNSLTEIKDTLKTIHNEPEADCSDGIEPSELTDSANISKSKITAEMAYEGVNNYCHSTYDWSIAQDESPNPSIMYVEMGEETEYEYQVVFRSYTGAFVYFFVDKASGTTRMVEYVPTLDIKNEAGVIDLFDYLNKEN